MKNSTYLKQIQDRLPDDITVHNETSFDFTEDEFVGILSWIKYFNDHYSVHKKEIIPAVMNPVVSKRLRLDFGLYNYPSDQTSDYGKFVIYIAENVKLGPKNQTPNVKSLISTWNL